MCCFFAAIAQQKNQLFVNAGTNNITQMLFINKGIHAVAKWLISQRVFQQFQTAQKIQQEDIEKYAPYQSLRDWTPPPGPKWHNRKLPDPPITL